MKNRIDCKNVHEAVSDYWSQRIPQILKDRSGVMVTGQGTPLSLAVDDSDQPWLVKKSESEHIHRVLDTFEVWQIRHRIPLSVVLNPLSGGWDGVVK